MTTEAGKRIFETVAEAKASIGERALASVWFSAGSVTVFTCDGSGVFSREEWDREGGNQPSVEGPVAG